MFDLGGSDPGLPWRHHCPRTGGIIFVVDADDRDRVDQARLELRRLVRAYADRFRQVPVLVFANKQDLPNSLSTEMMTEALDVPSLGCRSFLVQPCCSLTKDGLHDGIEWLSNMVRNGA